jgi:phage anti-repressor protein
MQELIKVATNANGQNVVSARDLHEFLGATERFSNWFDRQLQFGFIENVDYLGCKVFNALAKQELQDYCLTLDCAKSIGMIQRSEKGQEIRNYFIECEKKLSKPKSQIELIIESAQQILKIENEQKQINARLDLIEAKQLTRPEYFTIAGYGSLYKIQVNLSLAVKLGKEATKICTDKNIPIDKVHDPRFGLVGSYPVPILKEVFRKQFA